MRATLRSAWANSRPPPALTGIGNVEHVRALAGDGEQGARIVRVDRCEFGPRRVARVGVALGSGKAQERVQTVGAGQIERGRGKRP